MKIRLKTLEALKDHPDWEIKDNWLKYKYCNYMIDINAINLAYNKTLGTIVMSVNIRDYSTGRHRVKGFETQRYAYLDSMIEEIIPE